MIIILIYLRSVQGFWQNGYNVADVICASRTNNENALDKTRLIAFSDINGLKLGKFPFLSKDQKTLSLQGHSSNVSSICFDQNENYMMTSGAYDGCLIKWKIVEKK